MLIILSFINLFIAILVLLNNILTYFNRQLFSDAAESTLIITLISILTTSALITSSFTDTCIYAICAVIWQYNLIKLNQQD